MNRAETHYEAQDRRAREILGYRPTAAAAACPRVVAGKRCIVADDDLCVCQQHYHLLDHGRIWLNKDGNHVLTGEPYNAHGAEVAEFINDMTALGLEVSFTGASIWNPGHTLLIIVTRLTDTASVTENQTSQ